MELLAQIPPAQGRGQGETLQQPAAPGAPTGAPPGGSSSGSGMSPMMMIIMFLPMLLVIFLLNRSQGKKQKELESKLKKGDRVVTAAGLVGKITEMGTKYAKLELAPGVKVTVLKSSIQGLDSGEEPAAGAKDAKDSKDAPKESKDSKDAGKGKGEGSEKEPFSELKK